MRGAPTWTDPHHQGNVMSERARQDSHATEQDPFDLGGRRALVTGSSRGLGLAIARGLAARGAEVVLNGRDAGTVAAAVTGLRERAFRAVGFAFDVGDEASVRERIPAIEREVGPIDILVNNAGVNHRAPTADYSTDHYREIMRTNLDGPFFLCREVGHRMVERGRGAIINVGSLAGVISRPGIAVYSASKGAMHALTRGLAVEWAANGVRVNAIAPGFMETDMTADLRKNHEANAWVESQAPLGRWGKPGDLVGAVVFLASPASDYITGQVLLIDGGWSVKY